MQLHSDKHALAGTELEGKQILGTSTGVPGSTFWCLVGPSRFLHGDITLSLFTCATVTVCVTLVALQADWTCGTKQEH